MNPFTFHLIGNAHIDPVWLWDWQEGLTEGLITCRTILDSMDEFPRMTFIRGESAIYRFIEENDPKTFARIKKQVKARRWDVVGGTVIQPDTNLPDTEMFARHLNHGQRYFLSRFGRRSRVAWTSDSFGHSAGCRRFMRRRGSNRWRFSVRTMPSCPSPNRHSGGKGQADRVFWPIGRRPGGMAERVDVMEQKIK